jgi:hypothetical protein
MPPQPASNQVRSPAESWAFCWALSLSEARVPMVSMGECAEWRSAVRIRSCREARTPVMGGMENWKKISAERSYRQDIYAKSTGMRCLTVNGAPVKVLATE